MDNGAHEERIIERAYACHFLNRRSLMIQGRALDAEIYRMLLIVKTPFKFHRRR
jgi:hypothetical protein